MKMYTVMEHDADLNGDTLSFYISAIVGDSRGSVSYEVPVSNHYDALMSDIRHKREQAMIRLMGALL